MQPLPQAPDHRRIVITGIGLVTSVGADRETSWRAIQAGRSGARPLEGMKVGRGEPAFGAPAVWPERESVTEPVLQLALKSAQEALADSRFSPSSKASDRMGCVVGSSKGGVTSARQMVTGPPTDALYGKLWQSYLPHGAASAVMGRYNLRGPASCPVAACATGLLAVLKAADYIRDGYCDVALAGCADASLEPLVLAAFDRMGVLARRFENPAQACRPFDARRNGFLIGEGAAMFVVESLSHARLRGASIYAELLEGDALAEATDLVRLDPEAGMLTNLITLLLRRARLAPDEVGYVNLHGTATRQNDVYETLALKQALGSAAWRTPLSGTKSMIGHALGAAGGIELAVCLLAMRDGIVPPTINLQEPDRQCDLDYTPQVARHRQIDIAMKISLGFGGHLVGAVLRRMGRSLASARG